MAEVVNTQWKHDGEVVANVGDPVSKVSKHLSKEELDYYRERGTIVQKDDLEEQEENAPEVQKSEVKVVAEQRSAEKGNR